MTEIEVRDARYRVRLKRRLRKAGVLDPDMVEAPTDRLEYLFKETFGAAALELQFLELEDKDDCDERT